MDREQLLAFIKYLQSQGVPEKEITNMFGEYFGIEKDKKDQPDYTGMFEKYMPTFGQIESIQDPNSLMKSIAKDISSGVPIWDIKNGNLLNTLKAHNFVQLIDTCNACKFHIHTHTLDEILSASPDDKIYICDGHC